MRDIFRRQFVGDILPKIDLPFFFIVPAGVAGPFRLDVAFAHHSAEHTKLVRKERMEQGQQIREEVERVTGLKYPDSLPTGVTVTINGVDRTQALGGPFHAPFCVDVSAYIVPGDNEIVFSTQSPGSLRATIESA